MTDYHDFTDIDTPLFDRKRLNVGSIWINSAKCDICGDVLRSKNRHDYVTCSCGNLSVDGGSWYCKRGYNFPNSFTELSVQFNDLEYTEFNDLG
jgi:hypothetical protein